MKRNDNFILRDIGGEPVLIPLGAPFTATNGIVSLNETGRYVWDLLATECSLDDLAVAVSKRFSIDISSANSDVQSFVNQISSFGTNTSKVPSTGYGPLVRALHKSAADRFQPVNGTFELTSRCNLSCGMCYVRNSVNDQTARAEELSADAWVKLAQDATDNGMVFLLLTGGEIFVRPDFFDIYEPLTRMGLVLTVYTNGTLITEAISKRLAQTPPSSIQITLYGATSSTYEAVTGTPGSFARCCAGIENLLAHKLPLSLKTTVTRQNVDELEAMRQMAHNWGLPLVAGWLLSKRRDGKHSNVEEYRLSPQDCVELEATDRASAVDGLEAALRNPAENSEENFFCLAGKASFVITSTGAMTVCLDMNSPAVDPIESGFQSAWKQVQSFVSHAPPVADTCLLCEARNHCPRCPAWSLMETNTLTDPVPYLCAIAHARKDYYSTKKYGKQHIS